MALIIDPDDLNQGAETAETLSITTPGTGADSQFTGTGLPSVAANEFFEIRDHTNPLANGLWQVVTVNTDTSDYEVDKVSNGAIPATEATVAVAWLGSTGLTTEKSVYLDTLTEEIMLLEQGNLSTNGATQLAIHSFFKKQWKADQLLIDSGAFPMVGISSAAGQWEFGVDPSGNNSDWAYSDVPAFSIDSRRLVRNAGWVENDNAGVVQARYFNVTTLGTFEDTLDQAYYFFGDDFALDNTVNYAFTGPVNEAVKFYDNVVPADSATGVAISATNTITRNDAGNFITDGFVVGGQVELANSEDPANDGSWSIASVTSTVIVVDGTGLTNNAADTTMTMAVDNSNAFTTNLRIRDGDTNGKTFGSANLSNAGEDAVSAKIIKFPLANATDLDISALDASITGGGPWDQIVIRYFDQAFNREVDSGTNRDFGIVVDVGTHSGVDGSAPGAASVLTTAEGGMTPSAYAGGTLRIHEGTDENTTFPITANTATTITVTGTIASGTDISFTAQRSTPVVATKNQIYEKVQWSLRQATDIDATDQTVIGKMAGPLATFVGPDLTFGLQASINPNGGGAGVIVEGFDANDTNNLFFVDNAGTAYNYPYVAAGNFLFNSNLTGDTDPEYWLYFEYTRRTTNADIDVVTPSGSTYDLEGTLGTYIVNDYIRISGFAQAANNGLFRVTAVNVSGSDYTVIRADGEPVGTAETNQSVSVDENPYNSPDAIIVNNNAGSPLAGAAASSPVAWDFDYDNNVQGGRTAASDANCVLKASGLELAQYAQVGALTITRATGQSFSLTAALERNYTP